MRKMRKEMEGSSIDVPFVPSFLETPWKHGATACGEGARARRCIEAARGEPQNIVEQKTTRWLRNMIIYRTS